MTITKRQRSVARICSMHAEMQTLGTYISQEDAYLSDPIEPMDMQTYWSQSKLDQLEGRMKKALTKAKAARYDQIAPHYEQLCLQCEDLLEFEDVFPTSDLLDYTK